jgi:hypothetical protein
MTFNARSLFATLCLAALTVAFIYPAWAQIQQTAYYYGYADIKLEANGATPAQAGAGTLVTWPLRIRNSGPDAVGAAKIDLNPGAGFVVAATSGCINGPVTTTCAAPVLASGAFRDVTLGLAIHPSARGTLMLSALASSEINDPLLNNQQLQTIVRIDPRLDISVQAMSTQPQTQPDGSLRWEFRVLNNGPADALTPTVSLSGTQVVRSTCLVALALNARCPGSANGAFLGSSGELRYEVITPSLAQLPNQSLSINAATLSAEFDVLPSNNAVTVRAIDALFRDGFE